MGSNISATAAAAERSGSVAGVLDALRRIVRGLRESSRQAESALGISGAQLFVIEVLADAPALSMNELADRTHTHQSSVSAVVTRLVDNGLVERMPDAHDRRRVELTLSPAGRRLSRQAPRAAQSRLIRAVGQLPPASRTRLVRDLAALAGAVDANRSAPLMFFDEAPARRRRERRKGRVRG